MTSKAKKQDDSGSEEECPADCPEDCCADEEDEVDVEEQIEAKIKGLPSLKEKVQAIAINGYLLEKRKLDKELSKQIEAIEHKFRESFNPFVDEINQIVEGKHQFTDADFQEIGELLTEQEHETKHNYFNNQKISQYWLKVLLSSEIIGEQIEERDQPLLKHLEKIQGTKSPDLKKLTVTFYFSENEWFTNTKLVKSFDLEDETIKKSYGDQINWKEGKNITIKIVKKKNKKKGGEKKTKQVKQKSFFNFFLEIEIDSDEEENENEEDNQDVEDLELQYEMAETLYEDVVPKSLEFYLGIVETMNDLGDFEGEDLDDEDDDEPKKAIKGKKQ